MAEHSRKDVDQEEHSLLLVRVQTCKASMKINIAVPQNLRIFIPQDLVIQLLGTYIKDCPSYHKDTCSTMFIIGCGNNLEVLLKNW